VSDAYYLGIDLSWTASALLLTDGAGQVVRKLQCGTEKKDFPSRPARLFAMLEQIRGWLSELPYVRMTAVEGYSMGSSNGREMAGGLGEAVRIELWKFGFQYIDVPPTVLKSFVAGKGNAPKELMLQQVLKRWGYEASDNNDADGYSLARFARAACEADRPAVVEKLLRKTEIVSPRGMAFREPA